MLKIMAIVNLTPDSFWAESRSSGDSAVERINTLLEEGADIIDIGAVSTRPGAADVGLEEEWGRLYPVLHSLPSGVPLSIDTFRSEIVRRAYEEVGPFLVNDISAGEDDPDMLQTVGRLSLEYIAMHKKGNPRTMDAFCDYPEGVVEAVRQYFLLFEKKASDNGIKDWILDPGLGFAKTTAQNWELLEQLRVFSSFERPILIGAADKRFTNGKTETAHSLAIRNGADVLRVHRVKDALLTVEKETSSIFRKTKPA